MSEVKPRSLVDEYLAEKEADGKIREPGVIYVTDLTKPCMRNSFYSITIDDPPDMESLRVFSSGNMIEEFYVNEVLRNSKEIKVLGTQLPARYVDPIESFEIHGRIDVLSQLSNGVICIREVKSIKNFFYLNEAKPEHQLQINFYLNVLGIDTGSVDYLSKENMLQGKDVVDRQYPIKRNPEVYEYMVNLGRKLHRAVQDNIPPPATPCWLCNGWCDYKDTCTGQTKLDSPPVSS